MVERLRLPSLRPWPPWASRRTPALLPPLNLSWVWKFALWGENLRRGEGGCCGKWATSWIRMAGRRGTSLVLMLTCLAASTAGRVLFQWCLARNAVALFVCCSFYINPQWKCCIKQSEIIISKENRESVLVNRSYIFRDNVINSMACRGTEVGLCEKVWPHACPEYAYCTLETQDPLNSKAAGVANFAKYGYFEVHAVESRVYYNQGGS